MNSHIKNFLKSIDQRLPPNDLISSSELVKAGIVRSENTLARWRRLGQGPVYIKISEGQIRYLRSSILDWLRERAEICT